MHFQQWFQTSVVLSALVVAHSVALPQIVVAAVPQGNSADAATDVAELNVAELTKQLEGRDLTKRLNAIYALREMGPKAVGATDALMKLLGDVQAHPDTQQRVCTNAATALAAMGQPTVDSIVSKLKESKTPSEYHVYALAIQAIGDPAKESAGFLIEKMEAGYKIEITMYALSALGKEAVPAVPYFIDVLGDKNFHVQCMACDSLAAVAEYQRPTDPAVKKILELLSEGVGSTRRHAAMCLGEIGPVDGVEIVKPLLAAARDRIDPVRDAALVALGQFGPEAKSGLAELKTMLADKKYTNQVNAARSVWLISGDGKDSVAKLIGLTEKTDYQLEAVDVLAEMKSEASAAIPTLTEMLESPDPDIRMQSVRAIGLIGSTEKDVLAAVRKVVKDDDADVARAAKKALSLLKK